MEYRGDAPPTGFLTPGDLLERWTGCGGDEHENRQHTLPIAFDLSSDLESIPEG